MNCFVLKIFAAAMLCISFAGCGNGLVKVSGEVTCNGSPVSEGEIRFLATEEGPTAAAVVTEGRYSVEITPGEKRVEILGYEVIGKTAEGVAIKQQCLPAKFNQQTGLTCVIEQSNTTQDFALTIP